MKRLVVCCDGTWNTPDQEQQDLPSPTNVVKLCNAVAPEGAGVRQVTYYHTGVGTEGPMLARTAGGMYGAGLGKNIMSAYAWLAAQYEPGDHIFLFGFSRGAFTVRSLGGFLGRCGLLDLRDLKPSDAYKRVEKAYEVGYRKGKDDWRPGDWALRAEAPVPIHFIGVWDTVGALGIPDDLALLNLVDQPENWRFHDTSLGSSVRFARHAVALDEQRASFTPTLWTDPDTDAPYPNGDRVKQLWFPGVHSDVGGGYYECGLSDGALQWMIDEASAAGLGFRSNMVAQLRPDPRGVMHNSLRGVFQALRTRPRNIPRVPDPGWLHPSAVDRHEDPPITQAPYHPTIVLAGGEESFPIYAGEHWNATGLYLEKGATYEFTAAGEWVDRSIPAGPKGTRDGKFHPAELMQAASSFLGGVEKLFNKVTGNDRADFWGTRRVESMPWFALVGVIANDSGGGRKSPINDGSPSPHQTFLIGEGPVSVTVESPGYFYAFANDAWAFYGNNRGSVAVTVKRV